MPDLRGRLNRLEKALPVDTARRGPDGARLVVIDMGNLPAGTRAMTEADHEYLLSRGVRHIYIPHIDDRPDPDLFDDTH